MFRAAFLGSVFLAVTALCQQFPLAATSYNDTCNKIEQAISSASQVFYPGEFGYAVPTTSMIDAASIGSPGFDADISHWANSSSQVFACSVEPGTPQDVGLIVSSIISYSSSFH